MRVSVSPAPAAAAIRGSLPNGRCIRFGQLEERLLAPPRRRQQQPCRHSQEYANQKLQVLDLTAGRLDGQGLRLSEFCLAVSTAPFSGLRRAASLIGHLSRGVLGCPHKPKEPPAGRASGQPCTGTEQRHSQSQGSEHMKRPVDRRTFLNSLGVGAVAAAAAGPGHLFRRTAACATRQSRSRATSPTAVQDRPHDVPDRPGRRARRASLQGAHPRRRGDQCRRRYPRQAQDRDHHGRRARRHRRQRQRASPHEALREDRHVHRRHLERQHAGARPGRRGARPADDLRRRLHRLPVRQGGAESEIHLPHHQHPVGRRRDLRGGGGARPGRPRRRSRTSSRTTATAATPSTTS